MGVSEQNGTIIVQRPHQRQPQQFQHHPGVLLARHRAAAMDGARQSGRQHHGGAAKPAEPAPAWIPRCSRVPQKRRPSSRRQQADEDAVGIVCDRRIVDGMAVHQANDEYVAAIRDGAGALPLLIPSTDAPLAIAAVLAAVDGLLFTGAPSNVAPSHYGSARGPAPSWTRARDATTLPLLRAAIASGQAAAGDLPRLSGTECGAGRQPASACA